MAPVVVDPKRIRAFASEQAFETWLAKNHDKERELYLRIYKKDAGVPTINYAQALDVALCWGWIDGLRKSYDESSFLQRFSPRKVKSIWSQRNREYVERLVAAGRMTPHGLAEVEAAKADGRWDAAYPGRAGMTIPDDLQAAIEANKKAKENFARLDKTNLFALAFRLNNLKTAAGRSKRIESYVTMLARGETLHAPRTKAAPTATKAPLGK